MWPVSDTDSLASLVDAQCFGHSWQHLSTQIPNKIKFCNFSERPKSFEISKDTIIIIIIAIIIIIIIAIITVLFKIRKNICKRRHNQPNVSS